jgi:uncharacterized protein DUF4440
MRRMLLRVAIACLTFLAGVCLTTIWHSVSGCTSPTWEIPVPKFERSDAEAEAELRQIFEEYGPAQTRHDVAFFERVEADEFMLFGEEGKPLTRSQDIQWMQSLPKDITYRIEIDRITIYGEAAIANTRMIAIYPDNTSETWPSIDVCVRRDGRWQILSSTEY